MYEAIPTELRGQPLWGLYSRIWKPDKGKYTKIPYSALTGTRTSSTDPSQWVDFDTAMTALSAYNMDGLAFFFANGYAGIDIDHISTDLTRLESGDVTDNIAWEFMSATKSYTEKSMSGEGIHIIIKGKIPGDRRRKANVEMYDSGRFFAMTGDAIGTAHDINEPDPADLKRLYTKYLEPKKVVPMHTSTPNQPLPSTMSESEIIGKMLAAKNGGEIRKFLTGGWENDYTSQSEADIAFANALAFWCAKDFGRMDSIFRQSALMRDKWDEKRGKTTYGIATLNRAINDTNETYTPKREKPIYFLNFLGDAAKPKVYPPHTWDDTGNALRFMDRYGDVVHWSYVDKAWYAYNGSFWELDQRGLIESMADSVIADLKNEEHVVPQEVKPEEADKKWHGFITKSRANRSKKNMLEELKHLVPVMPEEFDSDTMLMNTLNGYVDLTDGQLHEHNIKKMFAKEAGVEYSDKTDCPEWLAFLNQTFGGDQELIDYLQKAIGYSLTGSVEEQVMFILYGNGRNGKSVFMDTLKHIAGTYSRTMQAKSLMIQQSTSGANSDIARLQGARLVTASEPNEGVRLDEGLIKELTGGDRVTARFLYGSEFEFNPQFKLWLATNHKPIIRGTDDGIWRRLMLVPFTIQVPLDKVDKKLTYKLERESIGILNWAIDGALKWQREGLEMPDSIAKASQAYRTEMDVIELFARDCCEKGPDYMLPAGEAFKAYQQWADENDEYKMRKQKFSSEMKNKFEYKKSGNRFYVGLRLKQDSRLAFLRN
jgi:putative DNA primase/helicase